MTSITKQCRSDDIGTLKAIGLDIIENHGLLADEEVSWAKKKGSFKKNKSTRGFNDNIFGRLLCPHKYSQLYSQDPDGYVMTRMSMCKIGMLIVGLQILYKGLGVG